MEVMIGWLTHRLMALLASCLTAIAYVLCQSSYLLLRCALLVFPTHGGLQDRVQLVRRIATHTPRDASIYMAVSDFAMPMPYITPACSAYRLPQIGVNTPFGPIAARAVHCWLVRLTNADNPFSFVEIGDRLDWFACASAIRKWRLTVSATGSAACVMLYTRPDQRSVLAQCRAIDLPREIVILSCCHDYGVVDESEFAIMKTIVDGGPHFKTF